MKTMLLNIFRIYNFYWFQDAATNLEDIFYCTVVQI